MTKQAKPKKTAKIQPKAKPAPRKPAAKKPAPKKPVAKKPAAKKSVAKKPLAKKPVAKKAAPQKPVAKKSAAKKPAVKKPAAKKAVAKKPAPKKPAPKKPAPKKAAAKKPLVRKPVAKKPAAKKPAVKKAIVKKPVVKKSVAKKPAPKKPLAVKKPAVRKPAPPAKVPAKKPAPAAAVPEIPAERRAAGYYNGVLLCERPGVMPAKSPYTDRELGIIRDTLLAERRHLLEVLRELDAVTFQGAKENGKSASPGYSIHLAEDASDNVETETALLVRREEEEGLMQVNAALERLEHSLFGVCVACGCKIGMPRLKAKPEAHLCIACKQIYDKKAGRR